MSHHPIVTAACIVSGIACFLGALFIGTAFRPDPPRVVESPYCAGGDWQPFIGGGVIGSGHPVEP